MGSPHSLHSSWGRTMPTFRSRNWLFAGYAAAASGLISRLEGGVVAQKTDPLCA